jgi:hypothetical protein
MLKAPSPCIPTAEEMVSNTIQCGFESHRGHQVVVPVRYDRGMFGRNVRERALMLRSGGASISEIHRSLGVSRGAITDWLRDPVVALADAATTCFICNVVLCPDPGRFAYLLGQYLGDGYLVTRARVPRLRIACALAYPGVAAEVDDAMQVLSGNRVSAVKGVGYSDRGAYWKHWPCLFPQHGPGMKHTRPIVLSAWQQEIVDAHPWSLIRGLIHSDGCRSINKIMTRGKGYSYPQYFFANESSDILAIMGRTLDSVGVAWRFNRPNSISIARRDAVELMDLHVGPKT